MRGGLVSLNRYAVRRAIDRFAVRRTVDHWAIGDSCSRRTAHFPANHWMIGGGGSVREEVLDGVEHFAGRSRRVYDSAKFGAVPHAMCEPASELLHFADTIGQIGSDNLLVVAGK